MQMVSGENTAFFLGTKAILQAKRVYSVSNKYFILTHLILMVFGCCRQRKLAVKLHYKNSEDVVVHISFNMKKKEILKGKMNGLSL